MGKRRSAGRARMCCPECLPFRRLCSERSAFRRRTLSRHAFADPNGADCCLPGARLKVVEPRGIAPRSTQCHCVVLLLDDGPESGARARTRTG